MANIAQSVNVISPLMTTEEGLVKQTTWWPLLLFSKYMRGTTLNIHVQCGEYEGKTSPEWARGAVDTPWLDCSASVSDDGWITLAVVNVHDSKDLATSIKGLECRDVKVFTVTGDSVDAVNTATETMVGIVESVWDGQGQYTFPKHSMTMLRWRD